MMSPEEAIPWVQGPGSGVWSSLACLDFCLFREISLHNFMNNHQSRAYSNKMLLNATSCIAYLERQLAPSK